MNELRRIKNYRIKRWINSRDSRVKVEVW